jgi:hypothetical protein
MARSPCVVLYGNSVFLAGIRADLQCRTPFELVTVTPAGSSAVQHISAYRPAAVVFDASLAEPDFTLALLREQPEVILMGVDPSSDTVLVLSGRREQPDLASDLVEALARTHTLSPGVAPDPPAEDGLRRGDDDLRRFLELIGRALADESFRARLAAQPVEAAASIGVTLSDEEAAAFKGADPAKMAEGLDERLSKAYAFHRSTPL